MINQVEEFIDQDFLELDNDYIRWNDWSYEKHFNVIKAYDWIIDEITKTNNLYYNEIVILYLKNLGIFTFKTIELDFNYPTSVYNKLLQICNYKEFYAFLHSEKAINFYKHYKEKIKNDLFFEYYKMLII